MPAEGRNLGQATRVYADSLNSLLGHTITHTPLIVTWSQRRNMAEIGFLRGTTGTSARVRTRYGWAEFFINISCGAVPVTARRVGLRILSHRYAVQFVGQPEPLLRWEYESDRPTGSYWCQHHLQGVVDLPLGGTAVSLNAFHLPTGQVPIEEVIRFLIVDLGAPPLDTTVDDDGAPNWHRRLLDSASLVAGA